MAGPGDLPTPPMKNLQHVHPDTGMPTGSQINQQQQLWKWATNGVPTIPNEVGGTANAIVLTPNLNNQPLNSYINYMPLAFVATATSTGPVTIDVSASNGTIGAKKVFINDSSGNTIQANSGDIVSGKFYIAYYNSTLDSGNGGFSLSSVVSQPIKPTGWVTAFSSVLTGQTSYLIQNLGDYNEIWIVVNGLADTFGRVQALVNVSTNNGSSFLTANYVYSAFDGASSSLSAFTMGGTAGSGGNNTSVGRISAFNKATISPFLGSGYQGFSGSGAGFINTTTAFNSFKIAATSGLAFNVALTVLGQAG